jgi:hypothetical protein
MMIRDDGFIVEFWLNSNNSTTWNAALPWSMVINGVSSGNLYYNYQPGAGWRRLAQQVPSGSQNVQFKLGNTGTSGFGGPTTFIQWINRAAVPPAPTTPTLSEITPSSMKAIFHSQGTGVGTFLRWELGYGTNPSTPVTIISSTGTSVVTGLSSGTTYYFWARGVNSVGNGPWSGRGSAMTVGAPGIGPAPGVSNVTQVAATLKFMGSGGSVTPISLYQFGWANNALDAPSGGNVVWVSPFGGFPPTRVNGLPPATTLYFRSRTRNEVGWSPWSPPTAARTIAGARVKVGPIWKEAVPYVKVAGVWRVARPWGRIAGVWKQSL